MTENRRINIFLDQARAVIPVGTVYLHGFGKGLSSTFTYVQEWLTSPNAFALAPAFPLTQISFNVAGLPGFLQDCAPDRWGRQLIFKGVFNAAAQEHRAMPTIDDATYLLGVDDWARTGALRLSTDAGATFLGANTNIPKKIDLATLAGAAREVSTGSGGHAAIKSLLDVGSGSLGGARPKATVQDDNTLYIAKFPSAHDTYDVMRWEAWTLSIAKAAGICVPRFSLETIDGQGVLLIERFDRRATSHDAAKRIPFMSAMTLLDARDMQIFDYADIGEALRAISSAPAEDLSELFLRMVLNVCTHNTDDHLRNHALLYDGNGWRLSPVFDINPNFNLAETRQTSIYGATDAANETSCLADLAKAFGIKQPQIYVDRVLTALSNWEKQAQTLGCSKAEIALFAPVIQDRMDALAHL